MSRMTITRYRDLEAERRRAEQREIQRVRKGLQQCVQLERELGALEDIQPSEYASLLDRLDAAEPDARPGSSDARRMR